MTRVKSGALLAVALLCGAGAGCDRPTAASTTAAPARPKPIHVDAVTVETRPMPNTTQLAGSLTANQESDVAANASGRVQRTMVERGSYVVQGAPIAQLDMRMASLIASESLANLETAQTQRLLAEGDCKRYQQLFERGVITAQEHDRQAASCKTARASAAAARRRQEQARQTLGDATVRAPFTGLVAERYVSTGEYVRPDTKVAHVVDIDPLRLELTLPEQSLGAVKQGQLVQFHVAAFPDRTFSGRVKYIGPSVRTTSRDLVFEAVVQNKDKVLRPGLFATAQLQLGTQSLLVVPKSSLRQDGDTERAFAIVGKHLEERIVQTGVTEGDRVAIVNGLKAGDRIVAHPTAEMADGQDVE